MEPVHSPVNTVIESRLPLTHTIVIPPQTPLMPTTLSSHPHHSPSTTNPTHAAHASYTTHAAPPTAAPAVCTMRVAAPLPLQYDPPLINLTTFPALRLAPLPHKYPQRQSTHGGNTGLPPAHPCLSAHSIRSWITYRHE